MEGLVAIFNLLLGYGVLSPERLWVCMKKTCNCCSTTWTFTEVKEPMFTPWIDSDGTLIGYLFQCSCESTLFIKKDLVK